MWLDTLVKQHLHDVSFYEGVKVRYGALDGDYPNDMIAHYRGIKNQYDHQYSAGG